jgi:MFS family permease
VAQAAVGGADAADATADQRIRMPREAYWLFCGLFLSVASNNLVTPLLPAIRNSLGVSLASIGTYVSAYGMARLIVDLPSGALVSRTGPRTVAVVGVALNGAASLVAVFAPGFGVLFVARIGAGVGAGLLATVILSAMSDVAPPEIRGRVMSLYQVANNLGIAVYPLVGGAVGAWLGWRAGFACGAIAAVLSGLVLAPVMSRIATMKPVSRKGKGGAAVVRSVSRAASAVALSAIFFGVVANMINRHGFRNTVLPLFAASHLGLNEVQTATGITVMSLTGIIVTIPGAALGDRIGRKRVLVAGLALLAVGDFIYPTVATSFTSFVFAGAIVGLGDFFSSSQTALLSDMVEGPRRALALGAYRFFVDVGALIGPVLLASLLAAFGSDAAIRTAAVILLAAAVAAQVGIPRYRPVAAANA